MDTHLHDLFTRRRSSFSVLVLVALLGCDSSDPPAEPAQAAFRIEETFPRDGDVDVARDSVVRAEFSASVDPATLTAATWTVDSAASGRVDGTIEYDDASRTATFTPDALLPEDDQIVSRWTTGIRAADGRALEAAESRFSTAAPPPPGPLAVAATAPAASTRSADPLGDITVTFSRAVDAATVSADAVLVTGALSGSLRDPLVSLDSAGTRLTIRPRRAWIAGERVTVQISTAPRALDGSAFAGAAFSFDVAAAAPPAPRIAGPTLAARGPVTVLRAGDLDGDGSPEVIAVSSPRSVSVHSARDDASLHERYRTEAGADVELLEVADVDADHDLDIVIAGSSLLLILENRTVPAPGQEASIELTERFLARTGRTATALAIADIDLSGRADVIVGSLEGLGIVTDSRGAVRSLSDNAVPHGRIIPVDIDGDHDLDLVHLAASASRIDYRVHRASSGLEFTITSSPLGVAVADLLVDDLDGDRDADVLAVLAARPLEAAFAFLRQEGSPGRFIGSAPPAAEGAAGDAIEIAAGDLDGDGSLDLAVTSMVLNQLLIAAGPVDGSVDASNFEAAADIALPGEVLLADVTGDGSLDVIFADGDDIRTLLSLEEAPPPPPLFRYRIDGVEARQGDDGVATFLRLTNPSPVSAFTAAIGYDALVVSNPRVDFAGALGAQAEFSAWEHHPDEAAITASVLVDLLPPIEDRTLPPGEDREALKIIVDVLDSAPVAASVLGFRETAGSPAVRNQVVVDGATRIPELVPGTLLVRERSDPQRTGFFTAGTAEAAPGGSARVGLRISTPMEADGFSIVGRVDPTLLSVQELDLDGSVTVGLAPDLVVPVADEARGEFALSVLFDHLPPFSGAKLPVGDDQLAATIVFHVPATTPAGEAAVRLEDGIGEPPLSNGLIAGASSLTPHLTDGRVDVREQPNEPTFLRGDVNANQKVEVSDAIYILKWLSSRGPEPSCHDAADADDNGTIDEADVNRILEHFFGGNSQPLPPPFPESGRDPTTDDLDCRGG